MLWLACVFTAGPVAAQADVESPLEVTEAQAPSGPTPAVARLVDVAGVADDAAISARLSRILQATGWFENHAVGVEQGVVSLTGTTRDESHRQWATDLAWRTEDVVAVVNRIEVQVPAAALWAPAFQGLHSMWKGLLRSLPAIVLGTLLLGASYLAGRGATWSLRQRGNERLADVVKELRARLVGTLVFLLGVYVALRVAGLTRLAATVLGGTGIVGLVLGIAFRDIAENVLASLLLTRQQPFRKGDLVEINGIEGYVQRLTLRATILMDLSGNHVQIPNSTVYKSSIRNYTSNPARRVDFKVGIGYADSIAHAQEVALNLIAHHPAVLPRPEPWVLVEGLGSAVVELRVYVWLDGNKHSWLKVRSSIIRLIKKGFQDEGISMPDEAREVVFPEGVPVRMVHDEPAAAPRAVGREERKEDEASRAEQRRLSEEDVEIATDAEARLDSEAGSIERLADEARAPEDGQDLLAPRGAG